MKKSTLIALGVFAVLAAAWGLTRERQVSEGVHRLALAPVAADAIVSIELGGPAPLRLEAVDGGWSVAAASAKEQAWPADVSLAQGLARSLAEARNPDFVTERPERQAELEVDEAKGVKVQASTAAGVARDLVVGKASKSGGTYVRASGSTEVYSVSASLGTQVRRGLREWRERRITIAPLAEVTAVQVEPAAGPGFTLVKETGWKLEGALPAGFLFDPEAAQRFVTQLTMVTAQDFVERPVPGAQERTITLRLGSGRVRTLHLAAPAADGTSQLRVDGEPQGWVLAGWVAEQVRKDLEGMRDLRLLHFDPAQVTRVTMRGKGNTVVAREGAGWKLVEPSVAPPGFELDPQQVDALLSRLVGVRGTRVIEVPAGKAGLGAPTVELGLAKGAPVTLQFGAQAGDAGELLARGTGPTLFAAPASLKTTFEGGLELFRKPPPPPAPGAGLQGLDQLPPEIRAKLEALRQQGR